jgi:membrane-associated protease RseP (regulator of RpoE activity)
MHESEDRAEDPTGSVLGSAITNGVAIALAGVAVVLWGRYRLELLLLAALILVYGALDVLAMAVVGAYCWGVAVTRVSVLHGPPRWRFRIGRLPIQVGMRLTGSSVTFRRHDGNAPATVAGRSYDRIKPWKQLVIVLSGPLLLLILAAVMVGPSRVSHTVRQFYPTFVAGLLSPRAVGAQALTSWFQMPRRGDFRLALGVVAAAQAMVSLLPLPSMAGGRALIALGETLTGRTVPEKVAAPLHLVSLLIVIAVFVPWAVALFCAVFLP